jgi:hypothetical protein
MTTTTQPNALREQLTATDKRIEIIALESLNKRGLQLREETNADAVARYAEAYKDGEQLPPIVVFRDPVDDILHLADGHHRVAAAKRAQLTEIHAIVKKGDRRAAILYGASANGMHGLALTNADKRKIVGILIADEEWKNWSNHEIARHARVSEAFIRLIRKETGSQPQAIKRKDGTTQKPRNAESKKPKQQEILDPLGEEKQQVINAAQRLDESGAFAGTHEVKRRILAALYWYGASEDTPMSQENLQKHVDLPVDTHAMSLSKKDEIVWNGENSDRTWWLTDAKRSELQTLLEPNKPTPRPIPTPAQVNGPEDLSLPAADPDPGKRVVIPAPLVTQQPLETQPPAPTPSPTIKRPIGDRRLAKVQELLSYRLQDKPLPIFTGTEYELMSLACAIGVSTSRQGRCPWGDDLVAKAYLELGDRLRDDVAELLHRHDTDNLPPLSVLGAWWGIDTNALSIQAERAVQS